MNDTIKKDIVTIIIRTLNEERYLGELLEKVASQVSSLFEPEVIIVDSGSTDRTLEIAKCHGAKIIHYQKRFIYIWKIFKHGL